MEMVAAVEILIKAHLKGVGQFFFILLVMIA